MYRYGSNVAIQQAICGGLIVDLFNFLMRTVRGYGSNFSVYSPSSLILKLLSRIMYKYVPKGPTAVAQWLDSF